MKLTNFKLIGYKKSRFSPSSYRTKSTFKEINLDDNAYTL